ncbi:MAG TPA: imidazoleglycerol-phosphate dehydratase HisB [Eggerthellaceae bacterium]|nr:imidazoleglycerol-phosphate dehydratase HisB [Eggerthellaceae bacterium]
MTESSRVAKVTRATKETDIALSLAIDGTGTTAIDTGVPFFDHMLDAFGRHGLFDLEVQAKGDIEVDAHHTVEDVGIVLGKAFAQAMGDKRGIVRFGSQLLPMDETLVLAAVDISGRGQLHWDVDVPLCTLGIFDTSLAKEFFIAFATNAQVTLHVRMMAGENAHHIVEACFKAVGRAMRYALELDSRAMDALPSTKGAL